MLLQKLFLEETTKEFLLQQRKTNVQLYIEGGGFICRNFFLFDISCRFDFTNALLDIVDILRGHKGRNILYILAKKAKARTTIVRLVSSAGTGYFFTKIRPRQLPKLSFVKFDPKVGRRVLFTEQKNR
ncbi:unnamed protein product [Rhizophagus irregularis]|uniref:Ribosomal protein L33 n=1 Tax=Rhizophagus irregularis TaxID=588596 RepID=A0A916DW84_9GLOM|nr:unnamed protein product [Rhizophagus irregularis]CAB5292199.1 unnamed protein product [Rhizophagus irregularis]